METTELKEFWGLVEIMGHNKIAGRISESTLAGGAFIRVDVPATKKSQAFTRLYAPGSIYAISPMTEETTMTLVENMNAQPLESWDIREAMSRLQIATGDFTEPMENAEPDECGDEDNKAPF